MIGSCADGSHMVNSIPEFHAALLCILILTGLIKSDGCLNFFPVCQQGLCNGIITDLDLLDAVPVAIQSGKGGDCIFILPLRHQSGSGIIFSIQNGGLTGLDLRGAVPVAIQGGKGSDRFFIAALFHQSGGGIIFSVQNTNFTGLDLRFAVPVVTHSSKGNNRLFIFSLLHQLHRVPVIQSGDEDIFHHSRGCRDQNQAGGNTDIPLSPLGGFPGKECISSFFAGLNVGGAVPVAAQFSEVLCQLTQGIGGSRRFQLGEQFLIAGLPLAGFLLLAGFPLSGFLLLAGFPLTGFLLPAALIIFFLSQIPAVQLLHFRVRFVQEFLIALP